MSEDPPLTRGSLTSSSRDVTIKATCITEKCPPKLTSGPLKQAPSLTATPLICKDTASSNADSRQHNSPNHPRCGSSPTGKGPSSSPPMAPDEAQVMSLTPSLVQGSLSPQPTLGLDMPSDSPAPIISLVEPDVPPMYNIPHTTAAAADDFPEFVTDLSNGITKSPPAPPPILTATEVSSEAACDRASKKTPKSDAPHHMTDTTTAMELQGGAEVYHERLQDSKLGSRQSSRGSSAASKTELTEEEQNRISRSVQDTMRLAFTSTSLSTSSATTTSSVAPNMVNVPAVLSGTQPPKAQAAAASAAANASQTRLGRRVVAPLTSTVPSVDVSSSLNSATRRPYSKSVHERMISADRFAHTRSPPPPIVPVHQQDHRSCTPDPGTTTRLSLAKLGRDRGSFEGLDDLEEDECSERASSPPALDQKSDDMQPEMSELFCGSGLLTMEIETRDPTCTPQPGGGSGDGGVVNGLPTRSPVGILCKSSSLVGSSATSIPELHLSISAHVDDANPQSHEDGHAEASDAASPVSAAEALNATKAWHSLRSRRLSASRQGKPANVRDTPRAVEFIGDEVAVEEQMDAETLHEQAKRRILDKMRLRRQSAENSEP